MPEDAKITITDVPCELAELPHGSIASLLAVSTGCKASLALFLEPVVRLVILTALVWSISLVLGFILGLVLGVLINAAMSVVYAHVQEHLNRNNYQIVSERGGLFHVKQVRQRDGGFGVEWKRIAMNYTSADGAAQFIIDKVEGERLRRLASQVPAERTVRSVIVSPTKEVSNEPPAE